MATGADAYMRIQLVSEANLVRSALVCLLKGESDFAVLAPVECTPHAGAPAAPVKVI